MKYLGIDYGDKKIGLAIADSETKIASPYKILTNSKDILSKISEICQEEDIDKIIIGLPLTLKSSTSKQTKIVLNFIDKLKKIIDLPIIEQDERLSSGYAKELIKQMKIKHLDDDVAAMIILQSYLDENF
ncbi:MAG: Holliday junction resolvase RuvX [Candidatus Buchananbacteria bacterium]|nr:Holliday junction resolvase RuvX [Candidatus Buchananbacteria bacterium]